MNIKALIKSLLLRKFTTGLLLLQLALTLGLLVNSAILAVDTQDKLNQDTGFDLDNILVVEMLPTSGAYNDSEYYKSITLEDIAKIEAMPGVKSVAPSVQLPIQYGGWNGNVTDVDNPGALETDVALNYVAYFFSNDRLTNAFGLDIIEGRGFNESDLRDPESEARPNIIISQSLANALYPGESAVGKMTTSGPVVGVVKDMLINPQFEEKQYAAFFYDPIYFAGITQHYVISVQPGSLESVKRSVSDVILGVQPERDIMRVYSMRGHIDNFYQTDQGLVSLFSMLGLLMIVITAISSYAYAQFHMTQQTKLIGIRRALGATRRDIMLYVLTENWLVYAIGSVIGIAVAVGFNVMLSQHVSLSKPDVLLTSFAMLIMFVSSTVATWWPALKTSLIPPVIATRTI